MIEGTPVVIAGVMYVTAPNQVYALDAATGREIWRYAQPRTEGFSGESGLEGVAEDLHGCGPTVCRDRVGGRFLVVCAPGVTSAPGTVTCPF